MSRNGEYLGEFAEVCTNILRCASEAFDETKTEFKKSRETVPLR